jgi:lysocardiolipin and lysophospholipid acyltransferase
VSVDQKGEQIKGAGWIETEVRPKFWWEFLMVFVPLGAVFMVLRVIAQLVIMVLRVLRLL